MTTGDVLQVGYFLDNKRVDGPYRVGPGDVLRIHVADYPELTRDEIIVLPDGRISLNLIGSIEAAGKTVDDLGAAVTALYLARKVRRPHVVVSVTKGQQRLETFLRSFGPEQGVRRIEIRVYESPVVDLPLIGAVGVGRPLPEIREQIKEAYHREFGSELHVTVNLAARPQPVVYVMGEVKRPGSVEAPPGLNLVGAVAAAGGFAETAQPEEVLVLRFRENGVYDHWLFDLAEKALTDRRLSEFRLQRGDVVYVAKSAIGKVNRFVELYIRNNLPINMGVGVAIPIP